MTKANCGTRKAAPPRRGGRKAWVPTAEELEQIENYVAIGLNQEQIAVVIGRSVDSLDRHCRHQLDSGKFKANAKIGGRLFEKAMGGDTAALIFWAKTQMGWKETDRHEHTGANGGPIQHEQVTSDAESFTGRISSLAARQGTPGGTGETKH
jgi:hypothetical protein